MFWFAWPGHRMDHGEGVSLVAVGRQWLGDDGKVQGATRLRLLRHGGAGLSERHGAGDDQSECFHAHFPLPPLSSTASKTHAVDQASSILGSVEQR